MQEREGCGCLLSGTARCTQLRQAMNQQHFDPFIWENHMKAKAAHLAGEKRGAASRYLRRDNFNRRLLRTRNQRTGICWEHLTGTGYNRVHLCLIELHSFTQSFCLCRGVSEGTLLQRRWRQKEPKLSPTCSRSTWGANLNCWANSYCLWSTSICRGRSFFQCFVFALEMFLVSQINFYGRFCNLRWKSHIAGKKRRRG